jgi:superfamily II DNA/RNA helicase
MQAVPVILSGRDVVIGSDTGSGKTLAYAVPVLDQVLRLAAGTKARLHCYPSHVVFVPNKELALQVYKVFSDLISKLERHPPHSARSIKVGIISNTSSTWPFHIPADAPDVVICVPAVFSSLVRGPKVLDPQAFSALQSIVYDEVILYKIKVF